MNVLHYVEGRYAYYGGYSPRANPYFVGTREWNEWLDGYLSARSDDWERS